MLTIYLASMGLEHTLHFQHMLPCPFWTGILPEWKLKYWVTFPPPSSLQNKMSFCNWDGRISSFPKQNVAAQNFQLHSERSDTTHCSAGKLLWRIFLFDLSPFTAWSGSYYAEDKARDIWIRAIHLTTITFIGQSLVCIITKINTWQYECWVQSRKPSQLQKLLQSNYCKTDEDKVSVPVSHPAKIHISKKEPFQG